MAGTKQTTVRFGEMLYHRLELAAERTGLPINSILIVACMDWLKHNEPDLAYYRNLPEKSQDTDEQEQE